MTNPFWPTFFGDQNQISNRLRGRSSYASDGFARLRQTIDSTKESAVPSNGPYMAYCLMSYPKEMGPPPGEYLDYNLGPNSPRQKMPWIICRVPELHSHIPNPANYDPDGSVEEQYMYWASIRQHANVGLCLPDGLDPNYHLPSPGEMVSVMFTNASSFSGARYKVVGQGESMNIMPSAIRSLDLSSPTSPELLLEYPMETVGGPMLQPSLKEKITPQLGGVYTSPFPANVGYELLEERPASPGPTLYRGLNFMSLGPNGGLGTPVVTIGRARIKKIRCVDSSDRFMNVPGVEPFASGIDPTSSRIGRLVTKDNYVQYALLSEEPGVRRLPGSYRVYPPERATTGYRNTRIEQLATHVENMRESELLMSRDTSTLVTPEASITGFTGKRQFNEMPIMQNITRAPVCSVNIGRYSGLPYGKVYYFTFDKGIFGTGTMVEYQLLDGPLQGETIVRCMHLAAVSPALLSAWRDTRSSRLGTSQELDVPAGTEIGLLGCQAVLDSPPRLYLDFGLSSVINHGRPLNPACYMDLRGAERYWCRDQ